jgi:hypothetical protein
MLRREVFESSPIEHTHSVPVTVEAVPGSNEYDSVLFKSDRIYKHKLMRFHHTTYDVRRAQDLINPSTSRSNVMMLNGGAAALIHPFCYARVLGIYHANVIYTGPGMLDYRPRRLDFLWVRWYQYDEGPSGWDVCRLDRLSFPPMAGEDAFGFLDPSDVLRGSHIIQAFALQKRHPDAIGLSRCAQDSGDWNAYYVNRYIPCCPSLKCP